jgi:hypothetical protein
MRIILSQKGFDSGCGGCPSPIIDKVPVSFPIPEIFYKADKTFIGYQDLKYKGESYFDLMKKYGVKSIKVPEKKIKLEDLEKDSFRVGCHLDPDIGRGMYNKRKNDWEPLFGQEGNAQSHIKNQVSTEEDKKLLFLFYGLFEEPDLKDPFHLIYGYFKTDYDDRIEVSKEPEKIKSWMKYHPHIVNMDRYHENNTIYLSKESQSGTFRYDKKLVLTKNGDNMVSHWDLVKLLEGYLEKEEVKHLNLSWSCNNCWENNYYKWIRGQEKFIKIDGEKNGGRIQEKIEKWANEIIGCFKIK